MCSWLSVLPLNIRWASGIRHNRTQIHSQKERQTSSAGLMSMNQEALYLKEGLWVISAVASSWSGCNWGKAVTDCDKSGSHKGWLLAWEASTMIPPTWAQSLEHKPRSLTIVETWDSAPQAGVPSAGLCRWLALLQIPRICCTCDLFLRALQP